MVNLRPTPNRVRISMTWLLLPFFFMPAVSSAWTGHELITRLALSKIEPLQSTRLTPTPFLELIKSLGFESPQAFNESIMIRKDFVFRPLLDEDKGAKPTILEVLAKYSNEPEVDMDSGIFEQYPQLWREEYWMMGGKEGTSSQAFRQCYWHGFSFLKPLSTFKLPFNKFFSPMGHAHERAALFIDLFHRARKAGQEYWAIRFLANALHYPEDVTNPLHSTQLPTKKYLWMIFANPMGRGFTNFVDQGTNLISYYHFSYEDMLARVMSGAGEKTEAALALEAALQAGPQESSYDKIGIEKTVRDLAWISMQEAAPLARASLRFFPEIEVPYDELDLESYIDDQWWQEVMRRAETPSPQRDQMLQITAKMFQRMGSSVRDIVVSELALDSKWR